MTVLRESEWYQQILHLTAAQGQALLPDLIALLQDSVAGGASIGFLSPLEEAEAQAYWQSVLAEVAEGSRLLLVARQTEQVVGTVQLALVAKPNARHRAEVQKLLVLQSARRQGIARRLMTAVEQAAQTRGRTLLVLDTRQGDAAESLYRDLGYQEAGVIPRYARSTNGILDDCIFFYKELAQAG